MEILYDHCSELPARFCEIPLQGIRELFPRPTIVELKGRKPQPLFVSIVLHGNEDAGLLAMQELIRRYENVQLPRSIILFIGNVDACAATARFLPSQVDYNRAWPGSELPQCETHELLRQVTNFAVKHDLFASIDVHNNTGLNPVYGCICETSANHMYLASLFSRTVIYFTRPRGVQTQAFVKHCPSVTCECGKIGDVNGAHKAADLIDACLHLAEFPNHPVDETSIDLYHTVARIKIKPRCSFGFNDDSDIIFRGDLDRLNFVELEAGETLGTLRGNVEECFEVFDESGNDVTCDYLRTASQQVKLGRKAMPSMFTRNLDVIRQDCLGYLMERYRVPS